MRYFFVLAVIASMTVADMHQKDGEAEAEYNSMSKFVMGIILASHFNLFSLISKAREHDHCCKVA